MCCHAKALGAIAVLGVLLMPVTLIGVAAMILFAGPSDMASSAGRMLVMVASYLLYFGIFIGIALIVSAKAKSSQLALVILLTGWFINSFVAPRIVSDIAKGLYPTPSAVELATAIERDTEQGIDGHISRGERLEELKRQAIERYNVKSVEELPVNFSGIQLNEADEYGYKVYDKHFGSLFDTYERQNTAYQIGAAAAPMLSVQSISMGLSGTDYAQHRAFAVAAEMYRRDIQKRMSDALTNNSRTGAYYVAGDELWKEVPSFSYASPGLGWVLSNHRWSLLLLTLWFVLVCIATPAAVSRIRLD